MKRRFTYDLIVLGSGTGGAHVALRCAAAGKKVALVESEQWGGAGNNHDIALRAMLHATHLLDKAIRGARFGLSSANLRYNYPTLQNWKNLALRRAHAGSKQPFIDAGIDCFDAHGQLLSAHEVGVDENRIITAKEILIATGASVLDTGIKIPEGLDYLLASAATELPRPPRSLFIVGAGATGCELAQYFATLGTKVVIADIAGRLLPREDEEAGQVLDEIFNRSDIKVLTQSRVIALEKDNISKKVIFLRGGQEKSIRIDEVLLATGSAPNLDFGIKNANIKYNRAGIVVNSSCQTSAKNIYALGDVVGGHSSDEKILEEAEVVSEHLIRRSKRQVDLHGLVNLSLTNPNIASVGVSEDDCLRSDRRFQKVVLPLDSANKANLCDEHSGFVKIILDRNKKIIGGTVMAPNAALVAEQLALALYFELTAPMLARTPYLHSDWGELLRLACAEA